MIGNFLTSEANKVKKKKHIKLQYYKRVTSKCGKYDIYKLEVQDKFSGNSYVIDVNRPLFKKLINDVLSEENNV